jgi:hypothetical protein
VADAKRLQLLPVPLRMDVMDHYSGCCDCCSGRRYVGVFVLISFASCCRPMGGGGGRISVDWNVSGEQRQSDLEREHHDTVRYSSPDLVRRV